MNGLYGGMRCAGVTVLSLGMVAGLAAPPAVAGPWARGAGDVFLSFQISAEEAPADVMAGLWDPETYLSFYGEVGLGRSLTLGADIGYGDTSQSAVAFLRYTLSAPEATWQFALDAGLGVRQPDDQATRGLVRVGASLGRGFGEGGEAWYMPLRHDGGWVTLDLVTLYDIEVEDAILQAEATAGFRLSDTIAAVFSLKAEDWPEADVLVTASPSFVIELRESTSVRLGARGALTGSDAVGLSLSLWQDF